MRIRAVLLAGAILALVQPGISSAQNEGAPAGPQATTVAAVPAADAANPEPAAEDDPMICRKEVETGTIGRRYKICMTKSQWEKHRQATRKFLRSVNQSRATQPGGEALGPSSGSPGG